MTVETFSGCHPFRPLHLWDVLVASSIDEGDGPDDMDDEIRAELLDQLEKLVRLADSGRCPRCATPFMPREIPSGSRLTACRCIPVCMKCSVHEVVVNLIDPTEVTDAETARTWLCSVPERWPVERDRVLNDVARFEEKTVPAFLAGDTMIAEDGASPLVLTPSTGGWAQFGHDDTEDVREITR